MTSYYLPKCCGVRQNGAGGYEVTHTETDSQCGHTPSGGTGGSRDELTPCNRIIGHGQTKSLAIESARKYLGLRA